MRIAHVGIIVSDLERAAAFYERVLQLPRDERPDLGFDGIFYRLGGGQQIHLMQLDNPCADHARPAHGDRDHHVALTVTSLAPVCTRLDAAGIDYTRSRSGRAAIFCRDPDGNAIELCEM
jgi:catechol 2,3-dioxygenase-like lactoylglutathione lyase family enzyme